MTLTITVSLILLLLTPAALASTVADAKREIRRLWGHRAPTMECIMRHENPRLDPHAVSRTGDHGMLQLNAYTWRRHFGQRWANVYDPVANIRMAYVVYLRQGFGAWVVYRRWCAR